MSSENEVNTNEEQLHYVVCTTQGLATFAYPAVYTKGSRTGLVQLTEREFKQAKAEGIVQEMEWEDWYNMAKVLGDIPFVNLIQ